LKKIKDQNTQEQQKLRQQLETETKHHKEELTNKEKDLQGKITGLVQSMDKAKSFNQAQIIKLNQLNQNSISDLNSKQKAQVLAQNTENDKYLKGEMEKINSEGAIKVQSQMVEYSKSNNTLQQKLSAQQL